MFRVELRRHDARPFLSAVLLGEKPVVRQVGGGVVTEDAEHGAMAAGFIELGTCHRYLSGLSRMLNRWTCVKCERAPGTSGSPHRLLSDRGPRTVRRTYFAPTAIQLPQTDPTRPSPQVFTRSVNPVFVTRKAETCTRIGIVRSGGGIVAGQRHEHARAER